jgi:hypothetical protein
MKGSLLRCGLAAAAAVVIFAAAAADVSFGATAPKDCKPMGVTTAGGVKIFGAGARASEGFNVYGWCQIIYGPGNGQEVNIFLAPKSMFQSTLQAARAPYDPKVALKGLGPGAVAVNPKTPSDVVFTAGAYTVDIRDGGDGKKPYPTLKEYDALALVVHAHLVKAPSDLCSQSAVCD